MTGGGTSSGTTNAGGGGAGGGASKSSKKKKKKMQKVNPAAMLGFTVNAAERPNMGEIQSFHDPQ
jgi:PERQ amino acid-rich with GYF domain-containing protein